MMPEGFKDGGWDDVGEVDAKLIKTLLLHRFNPPFIPKGDSFSLAKVVMENDRVRCYCFLFLCFTYAGIIDFFEWTHTKNRIISPVPQSSWKKLKNWWSENLWR